MPYILCILAFLAIPIECVAQLTPFRNIPSASEALWTEPQRYSWNHNGSQLALNEDGTLFEDGKARVRLPRWAGPFPPAVIGNLSIGGIEGELLIAYDADMGGEGNSYLCRFARNLKSIRWCQTIRFNFRVSTAADAIWVGAIGFIGRIDPKRGRLIWHHPNLYRAYTASGDSFNVTCPVAEDSATVTFESEGSNRGSEKRIVLNRASGEIISVTDIGGTRVCQ
jgi:hypothetical protein